MRQGKDDSKITLQNSIKNPKMKKAQSLKKTLSFLQAYALLVTV